MLLPTHDTDVTLAEGLEEGDLIVSVSGGSDRLVLSVSESREGLVVVGYEITGTDGRRYFAYVHREQEFRIRKETDRADD